MLTLATLNWEAVATLSAGIAAVVGAVIIGFRQTAIQSRQVELEELKIRSDLFDKRFATYEATADFLIHLHQYMDDPQRVNLGSWLIKYRESRFLFSPSVYRDLSEIFDKANAYKVVNIKMENDEGANIDALNQEHMALLTWFADRIGTVNEIFEKDLKLSLPRRG